MAEHRSVGHQPSRVYDTPDTKRAATCPSCGSDDPRFMGKPGTPRYQPHPGDFPSGDARCPDEFHSAHPVSAGHIQGKTIHSGGDSYWTTCSCGAQGDPREFEDHLRDQIVAAEARAVEAERERDRLRAWLRLVEATTDHDSGYYALHGYDAPSDERIEAERRYPPHAHPSALAEREER